MSFTCEVLGLIGRGGMAEVYLVRHGEVLRALKVLHLPDSRLWERLEREGRLQARLSHPNVLPVLDEVTFLDRPALLLPYVEGPALDRLLAEGRLTPEQAQALFRGVVAGVAAIHQAGLVHRDLKPGNVLLDPSSGIGVPRVSDFGLARALHSEGRLTRTGVGMGTPLYAAPEQLNDAAHVDARADVWALGALLVELLAGRSNEPFPARIPRLAGPWGALARALLATDPASRPAHAGAVAAMLSSLPADGEALSADQCRKLAPTVLPVPAIARSPTVAPQTLIPASAASQTLPIVEPRGRLPAERDDFIGRESDLDALEQEVASGARLVTVLGPGGVGKTRLALRWARSHQQDWPGGAWFVDLSEARLAEDIVSAVARCLELQLQPQDPARQLGHALAARGRCLIILDNFEQVVPHAEATLGRWLDRAEQARFVVTSRSVLGIPGEQLLALTPLESADAEALFLRRATAARRGFSPDADDRAAITELVALLDRLPLAIELAAARVRSMSPRQIRERLGERFALLTSPGARTGRHRALKATLDWSWELLSPDEQQALAQLSVFEGGFTAEAAEAVLLLPGRTEPWAALQALVDQSLVIVREEQGRRRMDLLVSVQEYASGQLGAQREAAWHRHGLYFARSEHRERRGYSWPSARERLIERANATVACRRALERQDAEVASCTLELLWYSVNRAGPLSLAATLAEAVLAIPGLTPLQRGRALAVTGYAAWGLGRPNAQEILEAALALARAEGDVKLELSILGNLGMLYAQLAIPGRSEQAILDLLARARALQEPRAEALGLGHLGILRARQGRTKEAARLLQQALAFARRVGDPAMEAQVTLNIAVLQANEDRLDEAAAMTERALELMRQQGDRQAEGQCLANLGSLRQSLGQREEAMAALEAALAVTRETGERAVEGDVCADLGQMRLELGRPAQAIEVLQPAADIYRELGIPSAEAGALVGLGEAWLQQGELERARANAQAALSVLRQAPADTGTGRGLRLLARLQRQLGEASAASALLDEALSLLRSARPPLKGPVYIVGDELGRALAARAELALDAGDPDGARRLLAEARALSLSPGSPALVELTRVEARLSS